MISEKIFLFFSLYKSVKTLDNQDVANLTPGLWLTAFM